MVQHKAAHLVVATVLISACNGVGGKLSEGDTNPEVGSEPDLEVALSVRDGWKSVEASVPALDALEFVVMVRAEVADIDALVAVDDGSVEDLSDAPIKVRFADSGLIDVRNGPIYGADLVFAYQPGVWYSITIIADVVAGTYDVLVGPRGAPSQALVTDALFDSDTNPIDRLSTWAVWSSQTAAVDIAAPSWIASGSCAPSNCLSLGLECSGELSDGCGGALRCGGCESDQSCGTEGVCMDVPPPPPACTPGNCISLGLECEEHADGCGGTLNCGGCASGQSCTEAGVCEEAPSSPPPACTPESCVSLGRDCGEHVDGCGGTLNCGGCADGQLCGSGGICGDLPPPPPPPGCTPDSCVSLDRECGQQADGCGGTLSCGACPSSERCINGSCVEDSDDPGDGGGDDCDSTSECQDKYGAQATDCENSQSDNSVCMCGSSACNGSGGGSGGGGSAGGGSGGGGSGGGGNAGPPVQGRIAYSADGNFHDLDDIGATPVGLALLWKAGLQSKLVHHDHSSHLGANSTGQHEDMIASTTGRLTEFGIDPAVVFDDQTQLSQAVASIAAAVNASSEQNPLTFIVAGPFEVAWQGIAQASPDKRKYVTILSHSAWNDRHEHVSSHHTKEELLQDFPTVSLIQITDQNSHAFKSSASAWDWMNSAHPNLAWTRERMVEAGGKEGDNSDAGMIFYYITGNQRPTMQDIRDFFEQ